MPALMYVTLWGLVRHPVRAKSSSYFKLMITFVPSKLVECLVGVGLVLNFALAKEIHTLSDYDIAINCLIAHGSLFTYQDDSLY